jgi:hypothetical protein
VCFCFSFGQNPGAVIPSCVLLTLRVYTDASLAQTLPSPTLGGIAATFAQAQGLALDGVPLVVDTVQTLVHPLFTATGTVDILWLIGAMAPQAADPSCTSNTTARHATGKLHPSPPMGYTGVRVLITDLAAAAADGDFQVAVY